MHACNKRKVGGFVFFYTNNLESRIFWIITGVYSNINGDRRRRVNSRDFHYFVQYRLKVTKQYLTNC